MAQANGQDVHQTVTTDRVINSATAVIMDTVQNGIITVATGEIANMIVPTNSGWFKPKKFVSSFVGKYAIQSELQTLTQSGLLFGAECLRYYSNRSIIQGQQGASSYFSSSMIVAMVQ